MNRFEFIMVLVSIIIGLGVAELLQSVAKIIRVACRGRTLSLLWLINMLNMLIQYFWASWVQADKLEWSYFELLMLLMGPIIMYIICSLLRVPEQHSEELDGQFINQRRPFFILFISLMVTFSLSDLLFGGFVMEDGEYGLGQHLVRIVATGLFIFLMVTKRRSFHVTGSLVFLLIQAFFIMNWTWLLS